ncbi:hypothetical protein X975_06229, partial [Stegodyphus mimosarum]
MSIQGRFKTRYKLSVSIRQTSSTRKILRLLKGKLSCHFQENSPSLFAFKNRLSFRTYSRKLPTSSQDHLTISQEADISSPELNDFQRKLERNEALVREDLHSKFSRKRKFAADSHLVTARAELVRKINSIRAKQQSTSFDESKNKSNTGLESSMARQREKNLQMKENVVAAGRNIASFATTNSGLITSVNSVSGLNKINFNRLMEKDKKLQQLIKEKTESLIDKHKPNLSENLKKKDRNWKLPFKKRIVNLIKHKLHSSDGKNTNVANMPNQNQMRILNQKEPFDPSPEQKLEAKLQPETVIQQSITDLNLFNLSENKVINDIQTESSNINLSDGENDQVSENENIYRLQTEPFVIPSVINIKFVQNFNKNIFKLHGTAYISSPSTELIAIEKNETKSTDESNKENLVEESLSKNSKSEINLRSQCENKAVLNSPLERAKTFISKRSRHIIFHRSKSKV